MNEVEKLLLEWINEKQLAGNNIRPTPTCRKAKELHGNLLQRAPCTLADEEVAFKVS